MTDISPRPAQISVLVADGQVHITMTGVLDRHSTAELRETLLDACDLSAGIVLLNLDQVNGLDSGINLPELLTEAQTHCWAGRSQLQATAIHPDVLQAITHTGITRL